MNIRRKSVHHCAAFALFVRYIAITTYYIAIHTHYATPLVANDESDLIARHSAERRTA